MPAKLTIEEMYALAKEREGKCLSTKYVNANTKLEWQCSDGHKWNAIPNLIKRGAWCPNCGANRAGKKSRLGINMMRSFAAKRGGKCLSKNYKNNRTKLLWRCKKGHEWDATPHDISGGTWCPECVGKNATIGQMRELAKSRGGGCLSKKYKNSQEKMLWQCAKGHSWEASAVNIKQGTWCPKCIGRDATIEGMQALAVARGGKCLSKKFKSGIKKLRWSCDKGHEWTAASSHIKRGTWCPKCIGRDATIEEMQALAVARGGKCLSKKFNGGRKKMHWRCAKGHEWEATAGKIKQGQWCRLCGIESNAEAQRGSIHDLIDLANKRGGKCLTREYTNVMTKVKWRCDKGHEWEAAPNTIKNGHWCPKCGTEKNAKKRRLGIEVMQGIASARGGKCLSANYANSATKLIWQCKHGHVWEAVPDAIKRGTWCPECSSGVGERICRTHFEQLFGDKFPKAWPNWLPSNSGKNMELDGYSKGLGIAFEYQGEHHFKPVRYGGTKKEATAKHRKTQRRDSAKVKMAEQQGVALICVPELISRLKLEKLQSYIGKECEKHGIKLPVDFYTRKINLKKAYSGSRTDFQLIELRKLAKLNNGKLISKSYMNSQAKLDWQCARKHDWSASANSIKNGNWCPHCSGKFPHSIELMYKLAENNGGKCLSNSYKNANSKLKWKCANGHIFEATANSVKNRGTWCPNCSGNARLSIGDMRKMAKDKGGKCLSAAYKNTLTKLKWQCSQGHVWDAAPGYMRSQGSWCPICAKIRSKPDGVL